MLDYKKDRLDYGEMLIPPEGYTLTRAVAATFSLDLNTLLSIPIALFYAQTLEGIGTGERIQLLEAIKRCPDVLRVYHQEGRISVPKKHNRLFGLLESCIIGIPPKGVYSSFHPKVWVLRYEAEEAPTRYRVIVLSRNLTYDRCWDVATSLVGEVTKKSQPRNKPLVDFVRYLVGFGSFDDAEPFLKDLSRVEFAPPYGFNNDFYFHPIGIGEYSNPIQQQSGEELLCISPFVDDPGINSLRNSVEGKFWLFSRNEELRKLQPKSLRHIDAYRLSDLVVEGESLTQAEDGEGESLLQELHAKLFVYKRNGSAHTWFIGSANATKAALERNVEFLLELRGRGKLIQLEQVLDDLLGADRTRTVFEKFELPKDAVDDEAERQLERQLRQLEYHLLTELQIVRAEVVKCANGANYDLHLEVALGAIAWHDFSVTIAPFNVDVPPQPLSADGPLNFTFENINESSLSRFLRFDIYHGKELVRPFLMKIEVLGIPETRVSTILKAIISDRDKFYEYLRFLLADEFDKGDGDGGDDRGTRTGNKEQGDGFLSLNATFFEQLLVTASRRPGRLKEINDVIDQLLEKGEGDQKEIVPQEFLTFWRAFRQMVPQAVKEAP
jgi:hypothetical protein